VSLREAEPLVGLVPLPEPYGDIADFIASAWTITPLVGIIVGCLICSSKKGWSVPGSSRRTRRS
jgi:hypothetical protein